ncbi:hypothetical protein U6A24_12555 [Aquimarina gracilis]|uniref:Uncharacterized protein n=1 Tax=Aquimarina gracilis TaxID=874422 RepID=A0ABU5ZWQ0_9FLAO|nr:hypothetical protein [Aquimarina gracilis]MEB3346301.1 hypothetical protein [Aquimarina gracilis]
MNKKVLKRILKVLLLIVIVLAVGAGYLYFRLHNNIDNVLDAKNDWRSEVMEFPLIFAGDLDYKGEEHIRFAPGWGEANSEDYFSYAFLWIIEDNPNLNSSKLENAMNIYFDGLMNTGAITNFNFFKDIPETKSSIQRIENDTFGGSIHLYDEFFAKKMIKLNAKIISEYCPAKERYLVWFYLSPQESTHGIWKELQEISLNIECLSN